MDTTLRIDPEDLEDIVALYYKRFEIPAPDPADPVILPTDPSLLDFAIWLDARRTRRLTAGN